MKAYFQFSRVDKVDEISCLIEGCNFLLKNIPDEAFCYMRHGNPEYKFQGVDSDIFPYLLVNIGSGVSLCKVRAATLPRIFLYLWLCVQILVYRFQQEEVYFFTWVNKFWNKYFCDDRCISVDHLYRLSTIAENLWTRRVWLCILLPWRLGYISSILVVWDCIILGYVTVGSVK